jgi:predicted MPP superfamily phosphohydrolase
MGWLKSLTYRRLLVAGIASGGIALGGYAYWEARNIEVTRVEIPLRHLPPDLDGLSVVQISDVHYGMLHENGRLSDIVRRVNDLSPDLVVITGDLVDEAVSHMEEMAVPLANLKSRLGVFGIMGNHEFFAGVDRVDRIMRQAGIQVLRNEIKVLSGGLQVLGIDDPTYYRRTGVPLPDLEGLLKRLDTKKPSILLYHQPKYFEEVAAAGIGLQLSGHIHGPQLLPMISLVPLFYPRFRGLYQMEDRYLYVNRGIGTGGPPMRLGSPPELVHIRLRSVKQ